MVPRPNNVCDDKKRQCELSDRSNHYSVKVPGNDVAVYARKTPVYSWEGSDASPDRGEKEGDSQQIIRYLGSHARSTPASNEPFEEREREREGARVVRTFLIYERAYFLGLLHMDIRPAMPVPRGCEDGNGRSACNFNGGAPRPFRVTGRFVPPGGPLI